MTSVMFWERESQGRGEGGAVPELGGGVGKVLTPGPDWLGTLRPGWCFL